MTVQLLILLVLITEQFMEQLARPDRLEMHLVLTETGIM
jgi:hypothetical protein